MTRRYGRAPAGDRAYGSAPMNYGDNITLVCGLRLTGAVAPLMFPRGMTNEAFASYTCEVLAPTLGPGDVVILDRLGPHKRPAVAAAMAARGARVLLLPGYSPDLNPVEQCGSKLKTALRSAAARTYDLLIAATGDALDAVTWHDAVGWFGACQDRYRSIGKPL